MNEEYRIPKFRVRVKLLLSDRTTLRADLFLGEHTERENGRERPLDLLNDDEAYFPIQHPERGSELLCRRAVLLASMSADEAVQNDPGARALLSEARSEATDAREVRVELLLEDGTEVSGTVAYILPRGEQRLQDFLNTSGRFFRVWDGETLHLVNSDRSVRIRAVRD